MAFDLQCISVAKIRNGGQLYPIFSGSDIGASSADPVRLRNRPVGMMMGGIAGKESNSGPDECLAVILIYDPRLSV
jgi:hypothetical protein